MSELHLPWLELSVLIPLLGALIVWRTPTANKARLISLITTGLTFICATGEWLDFATLHAFEAHDHWDLLEFIFHKDVFVIDELSAPLLPLAALMCLLTVLSTLQTKIRRFSFTSTLVTEAILIATLSCRGAWAIIVLLIAALIPVWIELKSRGQNTRVFVFHMGLFAITLVLGQALVEAEAILVGGALLTFAALLRSGICPLHCWLTDLFEKASFGTALLFVVPMTGAYAVMRLVLPIAPDWGLQAIAVLSLVTAVYAAGMALVQQDARRFFCYIFLSHSSLVLVGLEMVTPIGLAGALYVWLSVGISLLGFGLALRSVEARTGRMRFNTYHGLYEHTPFLANVFLLTGLASIGFPGTVGFVGTEMLVEGAVAVYPLVGLAVVAAAALNGIAVVKAYFHVFTGTRDAATVSLGCRRSERITILVIVLLIIGGGLHPAPSVDSRYHAAVALLKHRVDTVIDEQHVEEHGH